MSWKTNLLQKYCLHLLNLQSQVCISRQEIYYSWTSCNRNFQHFWEHSKKKAYCILILANYETLESISWLLILTILCNQGKKFDFLILPHGKLLWTDFAGNNRVTFKFPGSDLAAFLTICYSCGHAFTGLFFLPRPQNLCSTTCLAL